MVTFLIVGTFNRLGGKSAVIVLATYALLVGITLIGIHSWSIDVYQDDIKNCELYYFFTTELCKLESNYFKQINFPSFEYF